jgi:flavodoxin
MIISIVILALLIVVGQFLFMLKKDRTYFHSPPYDDYQKDSSVMVVYYSRTGNTEALARAIAREYRATILKLTEDKYTRDFKGWRTAVKDARAKVESVEIEPDEYDLSQYSLIFLGSPIWLFRPAPPLWSFVENNDLADKRVVLFNTFNSRFKPEEIEQFKRQVERKGGTFTNHFYIRRGRILLQMNGKRLLNNAKLLAKRIKEEVKNP